MSVRKTLSLSVLFWVVSGTMALADPLISNGEGTWSFWSSAGSSVTPVMATVRAPEPPPEPEPVFTPPPAVSTAPSPIPEVTASVSSFSTSTPNPIPPGGRANAFLNFGSAAYPEADVLTTGNAQPWFTSPVVTKYFGGSQPNAQQQAEFTHAVLDHVQETFRLSGGLTPKLTLDPSIPTSHTLSVVSGTSYGGNADAIGITNVGSNGFSFIDKLSYGKSLEELEWAVAHNVSHELMHAFGVGDHDDQTGVFLDAAIANWDVLTNSSTRFSDSAIADIRARDYGPNYGGAATALELDGDLVLIQPVPEPTTWALWGLAATVAVCHRRRQVRRNPR